MHYKIQKSPNSAKASQDTGIPTKIIKENPDISSDFLLSDFDHSVRTSTFPSRLKQENITPVFKKGDKNLILPSVSKIIEYFILRQISNTLRPFFWKQQCGF